MKAEEFLNEMYPLSLETPIGMSTADIIELMDGYAQHSAQERYDEAIMSLPQPTKTIQGIGHLGTLDRNEVIKIIKIASGKT